MIKLDRNDLVLFEDSFGVSHIARVANAKNAIEGKYNIAVFILKSVEKSDLNTANISDKEIIMKLDGCKNADEAEAMYPEIWL